MSEAELNSYRFGSGKEPTDEMLAQIMHEAAVDAAKRSERANRVYFEELRKGAAEIESQWRETIKTLRKDV